jgi:hypothetical protein
MIFGISMHQQGPSASTPQWNVAPHSRHLVLAADFMPPF